MIDLNKIPTNDLDILKGPVVYSKTTDETNENDGFLKKVPKVAFGNQALDEKTASKILESLAKQKNIA